MEKIKIFNINIDNVTMKEAIDKIDKIIKHRNKSYVVTPNVDHIVKLQKDEEFRRVYEDADLILADGMPLVVASKLLNKPIKEKVSGSDLFPELCELAAEKNYKVFFLGAKEGVADLAAKNLVKKYSKLNVVGTYSPPFGFEKDEKENNKIIDMINASKAEILFVGVGAPKQEKWIYNNKERLNVHISLAIGASFDFIAGNVKRAPIWMQKIGLEWFYRFLQEPKRMFKRYFVDDMMFFKILIDEFRS